MGLISILKGTRIGAKIIGNTVEKVGGVVHRGQELKHGNQEKREVRSHEVDMALMDYRKKFSSSTIFSAVAWQFIFLLGVYFSSPFLKLIPGLSGILIDYATIIENLGQDNLLLVVMTLLGIKKIGNAWQNGQRISFAKEMVKQEKAVEPKPVPFDYEKEMLLKFSKKSLDRLKTCHVDLQKICAKAVSKLDFSVIEGTRTLEQQQKYFNDGKSKLDGIKKKSKHQSKPSMAVDIAPYPIDWDDTKRFYELSEHMFSSASELKEAGEITHRLRFGGDWDMDGDTTDQTFNDLPHYELV